MNVGLLVGKAYYYILFCRIPGTTIGGSVVSGTTFGALIGLENDPSTADHVKTPKSILNLIRPRKTSLATG